MMSLPSLLPITVNPQAPVRLSVQIAEQIKLLIATGYLKPGDNLPTVTQLAKYLQINHNTIAAIYADLIEANYLVAQKGRGTFVACSEVVQQALNHQHLYQLLRQVFAAATQIGLSPSEISGAAYAQSVILSQRQVTPLKLVFVECFQHDPASYFHCVQSQVSSSVLLLHLEDLQAGKSVALRKLHASDLVITTAQHVGEVAQLTTPKQEVIGISFEPDLQLLIQISALPRDTQVLLVGQKLTEEKNMKQMLEQAGISHLSFQLADIECIQQNFQLLEKADVIYTSQSLYNYICEVSSQPEKVVSFSFGIDQASAAVLKTRLGAIQRSKVLT